MFGEQTSNLMQWSPPAIVVEDEQSKYQRLVQQGKEATALEAEGKHASVEWVRALKVAYPNVPQTNPFNGKPMKSTKRHPKVLEIVMEARQCTRAAAETFINRHKSEDVVARHGTRTAQSVSRAKQIRRAVIELTTKYQLGADPAACMDALVAMLKEPK